jgi:uncharacterized membrane protein
MGKQTKGRVKKITVVLIAVFLVVALTVTSASAKSDKIGNSGGSNHNAKYGDKVGDYNKGDKVGNTGSSYNKGGYNRYDWYSCWRWDSYSGSWVWAC